MLDDFREQGSSFFDDDEEPKDQEAEEVEETAPRSRGNLLGMTPAQRFLIALLLLIITCLLSAFCLLVTQRVVPTYFF